MSCMTYEALRRVTPGEIRLLLAITAGLTYGEVARASGPQPGTVARAFERLREKLAPYGGGTKAGLVHWIDTHYEDWANATGIRVSK